MKQILNKSILRKRTGLVFILLSLLLVYLVGRIGWVQIVNGDKFQKMALNIRLREVPVEAKRGAIYDCNGKELAVSISSDSIYAVPPEVNRSGKAQEIAATIAPLLGMKESDTLAKITKKTYFQWIKRKIDFDTAQKIKKMKLPGIAIVEESQRYYPNTTLASHVLGFAGVDNQGLEGIEKTFEKDLHGNPGKIEIEYDAAGRQLPQALHKYVPPEDGKSLITTIDEVIQHFAERELDKIYASPSKPKSATIIVMDPKTGYILALASRPNYDPNNYKNYDQSVWRNIAVSNTYEPGSTFKIVTASAAMEEGVVHADYHYYDHGYIQVGDRKIKCWRYYNPHGEQTFAQVVQNSCNPGFVDIGLRMESQKKGKFYEYIRSFGFGKTTGLGLPGEANGIVIPESKLKPINIATISIGQSIAVTPIQLITAASAVANNGVLMKPQIVKEIRDSNEKVIQRFDPKPVKQIISPKTAKELDLILESVVSEGTGANAYIEGYRVGGKTGTAQKAGKGGYQQGKYVASFLGIAPVDNPRLVCLVVIDEPQGYPYFGGTLAAPIFKNVVSDSLRYLGVRPEYKIDKSPNGTQPPRTISKEDIIVPDVTGLSLADAEKTLALYGLKVKINGNGPIVVEQTPKSFAKISSQTEVLLKLGANSSLQGTSVVPDLTGKRISEATEILSSMKLRLNPEGDGYISQQSPPPGTRLPQGQSIKAVFKEILPNTQEVVGP